MRRQEPAQELTNLGLRSQRPDFAGDPVRELGPVERRLQVDLQLDTAFLDQRVDRPAAHSQHDRSAQKGGELQLSELLLRRFAVDDQFRRYIAQRESFQSVRFRQTRHERSQRGPDFDDRVTEFVSEQIAVAGRAGSRIGSSARSQQDVRRCDSLRSLRSLHGRSRDPPSVRVDFPDACQAGDLRSLSAAPVDMRFGHVPRFPARGKNPFSPLDGKRHTDAAEKLDRLGVRETTQGRCEEFGRTADLFQKLSLGAHVGQVAAAFPRDADLALGFFHPLAQQDSPSRRGRDSGRHDSCRAAARYDQIVMSHKAENFQQR